MSTSCAKNHTKAVLCSDISIVSYRTTLCDVATEVLAACLKKEGKNLALQAMSLYFCCTFLRDCSCLDATFGRLFTLRPPFFLF